MLDPQGNSSSTYQAVIEDQATLYDVMVDSDKLPIEDAIQQLENGDIVASDPLLSKAEKMLDGDVEGLYRLKDAIDELDGYDYLVIDTAPSLNVILYNCLIAADQVIIPVTADAYSMQGLNQLYDTIRAVQRRQNPGFEGGRAFAGEIFRPFQFGKKSRRRIRNCGRADGDTGV